MLTVLAVTGIKVPKEEQPRDYITDTAPEGAIGFSVPDSAYYLRRISDGDLVIVAATASIKPAKKGTE